MLASEGGSLTRLTIEGTQSHLHDRHEDSGARRIDVRKRAAPTTNFAGRVHELHLPAHLPDMTTRQTPTSPTAGSTLPCTEPLRLETETPAGKTPLTVIRRLECRPHSEDLHATFDAAHNLGIHLLAQNRVDEDGEIVLDVTAYADEVAVEEGFIDQWWPRPLGWEDAEWQGSDDEADIFSDPRWVKYACRAMYLWVQPPGYRSADKDRFLTWTVDFSTVHLQ